MKIVAIYGAGAAGRLLAADLSLTNTTSVGFFIDEDLSLLNKKIFGSPIFNFGQVLAAKHHENIDEIHVALPSANVETLRAIYQELQLLEKPIYTVPTEALYSQKPLSSKDLIPFLLTNVVGREVVLNRDGITRPFVEGKHILITGAGGSIGSEIAKQCALLNAGTITLIDSSEYALYSIQNSLKTVLQKTKLRPRLLNICDGMLLQDALKTQPDVVFHAAAYKHVPLVEDNIASALRNNIGGTRLLLDLCKKNNVPNFVLISSDKAVRPTNVMGVTKRICEILTIEANKNSAPSARYCMVRFGNVMGSSGSVIPLFKKQIAAGGPVTITHDEITRFFMSIEEAAQLVIHAGSLSKGGEVFLLDMGQPVKIRELAKKMIEFYGYTECKGGEQSGIEIRTTGLRPGEKLFEELLIDGQAEATSHPQIFQSLDGTAPNQDFYEELDSILNLSNCEDPTNVRKILETLVPEYLPSAEMI